MALAADRLLRAGAMLRRTAATPDLRAASRTDQGVNDRPYRERRPHDKVVRSTHGVNRTGSRSWKVHVKDGLITGDTQETDYPDVTAMAHAPLVHQGHALPALALFALRPFSRLVRAFSVPHAHVARPCIVCRSRERCHRPPPPMTR